MGNRLNFTKQETLLNAQSAMPDKKKITRMRMQKDVVKSKLAFEDAAKNVQATVANKAHGVVARTEHENVGTKAAHRGELAGESVYRSGRRTIKSAYHSSKNRPKPAKNTAKQSPQTKKKGMSRFYQKQAIKQKYAAAKKSGKAGSMAAKQSASVVEKAGKAAARIVRKHPIAIATVAAIALFVFLLVGMFSTSITLFSSGAGFLGALFYTADYADICTAELAFSTWVLDAEHDIDHCPFELIAYLTAVHGEFIFAEIEPALRELFDEAVYTPFAEVIRARMMDEQYSHFGLLTLTRGARQFVGSPFSFDWLPFVSSRFGYRMHPISGQRSVHTGIDIALPLGTEILAGFDGVVAHVGYDPNGYGNYVVIESDGIRALYAHCHVVLVQPGQLVSQGDVIAAVGSTGNSTGPHLHMEIFRHGQRLNPLFFVQIGA
ncbi:MAG: peptidoglycan DD-metalloendopeptidase family protein [Oscillospiraceae bacterium]|nr:peptidoglycan DD-metalloendopeptidase family protein [Oscillospiraceae bacterium]